jgi:GTP-binding protein EngB required for normal cell division
MQTDPPVTVGLDRLFDSLDLAIGTAADLFGTDGLDPIAIAARDSRRRLGFLGETVVVALAGGTGSGKSSLLNAIAGEEIAETGAVRPTTSEALAWIPANPEPGLVRLLDALDIHRRVGHGNDDRLALIDLPDMDSYDRGHLAEVQRIVPRIDAVLWVFDPLKYNDRSLHQGFLAPLMAYESQFGYVLNHADRLTASEREAVMSDLTKTLMVDGAEDPVVMLTAAAPSWGEPQGIDRVREYLDQRLSGKDAAVRKVVTDVREATAALENATGVNAAGSLDFGARWEMARRSAAEGLAAGVVDQATVGALERLGESEALAAGGSPLQVLVRRFRRGGFGRALGMDDTQVELPTPDELAVGAGWMRAIQPVTGLVTNLAVDAGGRLGSRLRREYGPERLDDELRLAVGAGQSAAGDPEQPEARAWWPVARAVQFLLLIVILAGLALGAVGVGSIEPGSWSVALLVVAVGVGGGVAMSAVVRSSGRAAGRDAADEYRSRLVREFDRAIERRVGGPIRADLRSRAELAAALAETRILAIALLDR